MKTPEKVSLTPDEADALFGKRSKVKDSHDRYANLETNYLLKQLQNYKGVMFLTSNFKKPITKRLVIKLDLNLNASIEIEMQ